MKTVQVVLPDTAPISAEALASVLALQPQLVWVFASVGSFERGLIGAELMALLPQAQWVGCSTAGEIANAGVSDRQVVISGVRFDHPDFRVAVQPLGDMSTSFATGQQLAASLAGPDLHHIVVLGQGADINGSALVQGMAAGAGPGVSISGGLAGDGGRFTRTYVLSPQGCSDRDVVGIGFYGPHLALSHGSFGGWQPFGPVRKVTHAQGNVLYALDGERALDIYKKYLGDYAAQLPASGLLFPFAMLGADHSQIGLIRTILGIDEAAGSLILAGDVDSDGYLQLMQASVDALVDAAEAAAEAAHEVAADDAPALVLLVSCIGRKLVMGGRVDEEVEAVAAVFGQQACLTGLYSNGEISPFLDTTECKLHNQTMTITCLRES